MRESLSKNLAHGAVNFLCGLDVQQALAIRRVADHHTFFFGDKKVLDIPLHHLDARVDTRLFGVVLGFGMPAIALSYVVDYVILVGCSLWWLRRRLRGLQVKSILHGGFFGLLLGGLGAAAGAGVMWVLEHFVGALGGSILITLGYVCVAGVVSLAVTFGLAVVLKMPEVSALLRRK